MGVRQEISRQKQQRSRGRREAGAEAHTLVTGAPVSRKASREDYKQQVTPAHSEGKRGREQTPNSLPFCSATTY